jgi:predicted phosphate transport protein (TIGR00153 family)
MFIDRLVRFLLPKQEHFFTLLEEMAAQMTAAVTVFGELTTAVGHERFEAISARMKAIETEADTVCHRIYEELDRTFVTPIDREDLGHLAKALDDVVDSMEHAAAFAALYRFDRLTVPMGQLIDITRRTVAELVRAVANLRKFSDPESIREPTVAVHTLENEADGLYRAAIEELFGNGNDARELVRQRDMLFCLEDGVDRCEDAMDVIRSVVVKNG